MTPARTKIGSAILSMADTQEIHDFLEDADVVDGPAELRVIVAELWPELLHKVKPPLAEMH
jgi:hypothetical protein